MVDGWRRRDRVVSAQAAWGACAPGFSWSSVKSAGAGSGWRGERFERGECGGEVGGPGPGALQAQAGAAGVERETTGDVQEPVAQAFGFGPVELAGEQQALGPGDQVVREADELEPDAVVFEVAERQVPEAGVLSFRMWSSTRARPR